MDQGAVQLLQKAIRLEQRSRRCPDLRAQRRQRPGHRIVLKPRDQHSPARLDQGADGDVQTMRGIECENHLLRVFHMEEGCGLLTAPKGRLGGQMCRLMSPSARCGHGTDGPGYRCSYAGRLLYGGGRAVQVDQKSSTSL